MLAVLSTRHESIRRKLANLYERLNSRTSERLDIVKDPDWKKCPAAAAKSLELLREMRSLRSDIFNRQRILNYTQNRSRELEQRLQSLLGRPQTPLESA